MWSAILLTFCAYIVLSYSAPLVPNSSPINSSKPVDPLANYPASCRQLTVAQRYANPKCHGLVKPKPAGQQADPIEGGDDSGGEASSDESPVPDDVQAPVSYESPEGEGDAQPGEQDLASDTEADPELFEGDILGVEKGEDMEAKGGLSSGLISAQARWPQNTLPYVMDTRFSSDEQSKIKAAMQFISSKTCIKFKPRGSERDYAKFIPGNGCSSFVGKVGGEQKINYGRGCFSAGTLQHEIMHALGFHHEQARTDRDNYIEINFANIMEGYAGNFQKYDTSKITDFGLPYDYGSAMHYPRDAFAKDKNIWVVRPRKPYQNQNIGQRIGLSKTDIELLNRMYKCQKRDEGWEGAPEDMAAEIPTVKSSGEAAPAAQ